MEKKSFIFSSTLLTLLTFSLMLPYVLSQEEVAIYNLISRANDPTTEWATGTLPTGADHAVIPFGGDPNPAGMVRYHTNKKLNDGQEYPLVLETHPKWVDNGYIQGRYEAPVYVPVSGAKLRVLVGFLEGAGAGRARVQINLIVPGSSPLRLIPLLNQEISYADGVREFTVDFPSETHGNSYEIALIALAGETSAQDWVAWARVWITARVGVISTTTSTTTTTAYSTTTTTSTTTITTGTTSTVTETVETTATETTTKVETMTTTTTAETERTLTTTFTEIQTEQIIRTQVVTQTVTPQTGIGGRCLIATAAFGSELAQPVQALRDYRDGFVLQTFGGRTFMEVFNSFYYSWSPAVAEQERQNPLLREAVKISIYPLIGVLETSKTLAQPLWRIHPEASVLVAGMLTSVLLGIIYLAPLASLIRLVVGRRVKTGFGLLHVSFFMTCMVVLFFAGYAFSNTFLTAFTASAVVLSGLTMGCLIPFTLATRAGLRRA